MSGRLVCFCIDKPLAQVGANIVRFISLAAFQHVGACRQGLANKLRALLNCVGCLPDCIDHEGMGTDSQLSGRRRRALLEFLGELE
jgi:hypothetical protein